MCIGTSPASAGEVLESAAGLLAGLDATEMPAEAVAEVLRGMERADAVLAAARGRLLAAFDAKNGHLTDGQRTTRSWLVHSLRVTRGQAAEHKAAQALARDHGPLLAALADGHVLTKSAALQLASGPSRSRRSSVPRPRRSWSPRPGPALAGASWRRSARRSVS